MLSVKGEYRQIPIYQVEAFSSRLFGGNPAAVCILDEWIDEKRMQSIAAENNLSKTAFLVPNPEGSDLSLFIPNLAGTVIMEGINN